MVRKCKDIPKKTAIAGTVKSVTSWLLMKIQVLYKCSVCVCVCMCVCVLHAGEGSSAAQVLNTGQPLGLDTEMQ